MKEKPGTKTEEIEHIVNEELDHLAKEDYGNITSKLKEKFFLTSYGKDQPICTAQVTLLLCETFNGFVW
ncbi:MAG: hypothetical protein EOO38_17370 [Cytophagaceae bacterium]|nr:MAG: hypothetical protein EOO38_17370 [Cytophagaceae bacterium]